MKTKIEMEIEVPEDTDMDDVKSEVVEAVRTWGCEVKSLSADSKDSYLKEVYIGNQKE